jgi:hypothetical protein
MPIESPATKRPVDESVCCFRLTTVQKSNTSEEVAIILSTSLKGRSEQEYDDRCLYIPFAAKLVGQRTVDERAKPGGCFIS